MPRRYTPTLYRHVEEKSDDLNVDTPGIHTGYRHETSAQHPAKSGTKQRSPALAETRSSPRKDIYSMFVKRYRQQPSPLGDPRGIHHNGTLQLFDESSDEEYPESPQGVDYREYHGSLPVDNGPMEPYSSEDRERLEWQSMLASVLDGDVLKSEKSRIQVALLASSNSGNSRNLDIWFGLRAKLRGRSVEEERKLLEERKMHLVDRVISEILQFRVIDNPGFPSASHQVNVILQHLDKIQSFYPHLKAFHQDKPLASQPDFQMRCDTLISWSNVHAALKQQINIFRKWTGSETLDVMAHSAEHDGTTFVERVLKEETIQRTFEKGSLNTVHALIASARDTQVNRALMFRTLNLPTFDNELVQLISFPTRLAHALLRSRLDYANRVKDPDDMIIDQMLEDFRIAIGLACTLKRQYAAFLLPDPGGNWNLPSCISEDYDETLRQTCHLFCRMVQWKLKSGSKDIYSREPEFLESQWNTFNDLSLVVEGGAYLVALQFCSMTNKLYHRVINSFQRQINIPVYSRKKLLGITKPLSATYIITNADGSETEVSNNLEAVWSIEDMVKWYERVLDEIKKRYRKLQRFTRSLTQRFGNAAEYTLEDVQLDTFIATLVETDHFLVYTQSIEEDGTYIIASRGLRDRPDAVRRIIQDPFHVHDIWEDNYPSAQRTGASSDFDVGTEEERRDDDSAYLLILSPRSRFLWNGLVMMLPLSRLDFEMKDNRIRLVADGPNERLNLAKERFAELFIVQDEDEETIESYPNIVIDHMAHLPAINRELRKLAVHTVKLAESIINGANDIRRSTSDFPGTTDLRESWYSFAADHGQHAQKYMDKASWLQFNRYLIRLAIEWVSFICDDCDPTDRKTFRWAVSALEFVMLRTRRNNILLLPEEQFEMLRQKVASCMTLLISHFDILGARSAQDALREKEKQEELRQVGNEIIIPTGNEEDFWEPVTPASGTAYEEHSFANMVTSGDRSIKRFRESTLRHVHELEERRFGVGVEQNVVGRVLDDQKPEDKSLMFLASATSNVSIRWQQGKFIGAGAFGSVYTAINLDTGSVMAVKEIRVQDVSGTPNLYKQIQDELRVMEMLHHPNIVEYYGIEVHRDKVYIFEEYCEGGSLAANLEFGRIADESILQVYTENMLAGLIYLHSQNIVHRDIKPDNILLDHNGVLKFVDFGAAKVIAKNTRTVHRTRMPPLAAPAGNMAEGGPTIKNSLTGTPMYMSPEVIKNDKHSRHGAMDIWSLGCVVLECATGRKPWSNLDNEWAIMFHIGIATQHPPLPEKGELSELGIDFIKQCLTIDPMLRPTAEELLDHPWMWEFVETLHMLEEEELAASTNAEMLPSEDESQGGSKTLQAAVIYEKGKEPTKAASPESVNPGSDSSLPIATLNDLSLSETVSPPLNANS